MMILRMVYWVYYNWGRCPQPRRHHRLPGRLRPCGAQQPRPRIHRGAGDAAQRPGLAAAGTGAATNGRGTSGGFEGDR